MYVEVDGRTQELPDLWYGPEVGWAVMVQHDATRPTLLHHHQALRAKS